MSSPYAYPSYLTPYLWPYYQQVPNSPFIPPAQVPLSPRSSEASRRVRFSDGDDQYPPTRPRPPSWHAGMAGSAPPPNPQYFPSPPFIYNQLPPVAMPSVGPPPGYVPHRRSSDTAVHNGGHPAWVTVPTWMVYPQPAMVAPPPSQFHPLLNGEGGNRPLLFFDLSVHTFNPLRIPSHGRTTGIALTYDELSQQATHPGVTRMEIICDAISQWPIVLEPQLDRPANSRYLNVPSSPSADFSGPITVGDVLVAIHRVMQTQISHRDWVQLSPAQETNVARAYTRRCRTFPSLEEFESRQGVRRVDYLGDKIVFKGLTRLRGDDGFELVRLLIGPR
ncbi:hypothetical protein EUX98_g6545 [Antrodiella citrinella]|uniref:DUF6699 domain-containing protein n=1 Tax=Antrodiella citrinella TaxID=2447956 RepID=A0A4S4MNP9_9APHY|nr:hypothetical protein EUX98_g6545 [Antrodiella citrinella]